MAKQDNIEPAQMLRIFEVASKGRSKAARTRAYNQIYKEMLRQSRRANARMLALEKKDRAYGQAYDVASTYLEGKGRKRFSPNAKNLNDLKVEYLRINAFLRSSESTIRGQIKIEKKRIATYREKYSWVNENGHRVSAFNGISDKEMVEFFKFLGNQSVTEYLSFYNDSSEQVEQLAELFKEDSRKQKLMDLFEDYQKTLKWLEENPDTLPSDNPHIAFSELREELNTLYESARKRRR